MRWISPASMPSPTTRSRYRSAGEPIFQWFAGTAGWEVWYDAGKQRRFPFRRRPNGIIKRPIGRMKSIAQGNEQHCSGGHSTTGFMPRSDTRSTADQASHAIERVIADAYEVSIAQSYCYDQLGLLSSYCPQPCPTRPFWSTDTVTKVFSTTSSSGADGNGPWRPSCAAQTRWGCRSWATAGRRGALPIGESHGEHGCGRQKG